MRVISSIVILLISLTATAQKPMWYSVFTSQSDTGKVNCNQVIKTIDDGFALTGFFDHKLTIADTSVWTAGGQDGFVAKLDSNWNLNWIKVIAGPGDDAGLTISELSNGDIIVGAKFYDSIEISGNKLISKGGCDILLFSINASGTIKWAKTAGGIGDDFIGIGLLGYAMRPMLIDFKDQIYLTGSFGKNNSSPPLKLGAYFDSITIVAERGADVFIALYDSTGNIQWVKSAGGPYTDFGSSISLRNNKIAITGSFTCPWIQFDSIQLNSKECPFQDMFTSQYTTSGEFEWAIGAGNKNAVSGSSIAIDHFGNNYVIGDYFDDFLKFGTMQIPNKGDFDMFIAKYDSLGYLLWANGGVGSGTDIGGLVEVDLIGNVYISGYFSWDGTFGLDTLYGFNRDVFIAKLNPNGEYQWAIAARGGGDETPFDLLVIDENEIYVTGYFTSASVEFGSHTIYNPGEQNFFIARLGPDTSTGLIEQKEIPVKIYPNPVTGTAFDVEFPQGIFDQLEVIDLYGRCMFEVKIDRTLSKYRLSNKNWTNGIYFIHLTGSSGTVTKSIIVH